MFDFYEFSIYTMELRKGKGCVMYLTFYNIVKIALFSLFITMLINAPCNLLWSYGVDGLILFYGVILSSVL